MKRSIVVTIDWIRKVSFNSFFKSPLIYESVLTDIILSILYVFFTFL